MEENKRLEQGFDDPGRQVVKNRIEHFWTDVGNPYGDWWDVVKKYLLTAYNTGEKHSAITVAGKNYKILKRDGVTVFYDENGQTLFDVENDRLAKEHELLAAENDRRAKEHELLSAENAAEEPEGEESTEEPVEEPGEGPKSEIGKVIAGIERQAFDAAVNGEKTEDAGAKKDSIPMGTASLAEIIAGIPAPTEEEIRKAEEENAKPVKQRAKEKLEKELQSASEKGFADPVIKHLLERIEQSDSLAADVCQKHKTWNKCYKYIRDQAYKRAQGGVCAAREDVVYEWAEDYYHKDDKAEEVKKAEEQRKKQEKAKTPEKKKAPEKAVPKNPGKSEKTDAKKPEKKQSVDKAPVEKPKAEPKHKKSGNDMEGQMDLFSMMGM